MGPSHHPDPDELLAYAAGTSEDWLSALIACHLTLCPACRREVSVLEGLGGAMLEAWSLPDDGDEVLQRRDRVRVTARPSPPATPVPPEIARVVPRPLHGFMADVRPRFRFLAPGLAHVPLSLEGGGRPIRLVRFRPGFVVPEHAHDGPEWLLILSGELHDLATGERFGPGDVSRRDTADVHAQAIGKREPCIAAFANIGAPIPRTLMGRVLSRIVGL